MEKEHREMVVFGFNKKSVDLFLKKLHHLHETELQELKTQVESSQKKGELLNKELKDLRDRQRQNRTKDVLEQVLLQSDDSVSKPQSTASPAKPTLKLISNRESELVQEDKPKAKENIIVNDQLDAPNKSDTKQTTKRILPAAGGFWGDAELYLDENGWIPEDIIELSAPLQDVSPYKEIAAAHQTAEEEQAIPKEDVLREPENLEIEKIKRNYIVGKLAGENLLDSQGRMIISKNAIISVDTIKRAQQEGKLAELIVNMVLPR